MDKEIIEIDVTEYRCPDNFLLFNLQYKKKPDAEFHVAYTDVGFVKTLEPWCHLREISLEFIPENVEQGTPKMAIINR